MRFEVAAKQAVSGREAYRIRFGPRDAKEFAWTGEALIDEEDLQPISVYTRLSRRIQFFVRALFGTDVPGLGFSVKYARIDKDVCDVVEVNLDSTVGTEIKKARLCVVV